MGNTQAAAAKDKVQAVNEKAKARNTNSARPKQAAASSDSGFSNWRQGNFGAPTPAVVPEMPYEAPEIISGEDRKNADLGITTGKGKGRQGPGNRNNAGNQHPS